MLDTTCEQTAGPGEDWKMKVLVTGGAGFIGSHLVERLLQEKDVATVRVVDNLSTGKVENLRSFLPRLEFIHADLTHESVAHKATEGIDVVLHHAAIPSVPRSIEQPLENHLNGAHATLLLLDAARRNNVRRVVFAGSSSAYGETPTLPKVETMLPQSLSPYAAAKLAGEFYCVAFARCYPLDTVVLRYFNIFGPRQTASSPYSGVIARFCRSYCLGDPLKIFGDGEQSRDFTYVANVVEANLLAARQPERLNGEIINVGCGESISLNDLIEALNQISGKSLKPIYEASRAGDVMHSLADIRRGFELLKYTPIVNFKEGLARTLYWYQQGGGLAFGA
jgi:UDP-glucose 4-epimerase